MIAKRINRSAGGRFGLLAEYIAAAKDPGEKLDQLWTVNADPDLDLAIREIEAAQALNTRARSDKSYHLVVSFRDEKPPAEDLRDIEWAFARALGFEDHQRIAATHQNTGNFHMHVAYSKINPTTHKIHIPRRDFRDLEKTCRAMEKQYGLKVDPGRSDKIEADRKPQAARDMEAESWEQSFYSYVESHKAALLQARDRAKSWQDVHAAFANYNLVLKKRGNGLVIGDLSSSKHVKASSIDRSLAKPAMEKKLGPWQGPKLAQERPNPKRRYQPYANHPSPPSGALVAALFEYPAGQGCRGRDQNQKLETVFAVYRHQRSPRHRHYPRPKQDDQSALSWRRTGQEGIETQEARKAAREKTGPGPGHGQVMVFRLKRLVEPRQVARGGVFVERRRRE